ncbi:MAG TPA: ARMT1-like domain-containing protein, partial [Planctomycetota bacterium]|nr:ARMT1-like domain-containing protein [Planctomycetota bacterium]
MKNGPECIPCCLRRILQVSRLVTADEWLHRKILDEAMPELARVDELSSPAEVVHAAFKRAAKTLGDPDPFAPEKRRWVEETVGNIELFRESIQASPDPFRRALELSLAANIFDSEFREEVDPGFSLRALLKNDSPARFAPSVAENLEDFRDAVERSQRILFVHDSAG